MLLARTLLSIVLVCCCTADAVVNEHRVWLQVMMFGCIAVIANAVVNEHVIWL